MVNYVYIYLSFVISPARFCFITKPNLLNLYFWFTAYYLAPILCTRNKKKNIVLFIHMYIYTSKTSDLTRVQEKKKKRLPGGGGGGKRGGGGSKPS